MLRIARFAPVGLVACLVGLASAGENPWQTDFKAAQAKAKSEKKLLLVNFTGSDWCGWCIRLKQEVFDKEAFQAEAPKRFVLVELDFPREKTLPEELKTQNQKLAEQYDVQGYPTILVLDAEGQVIARTGYRPGGDEPYLKHLAEIVQVHESILAMRVKLPKVKGLDRAKLLDELIEAYGKLDNEIDDIEAWSKEIIALDSENKAGLKLKYEFRSLMAEATKLKESEKFDEAAAALDKALALPGLSGQQKQDAYFAQGECSFHRKDFVAVVACLNKAMEAAPESPKAATLKAMLKRFAEPAEAQETVAKLKAELKGAKGLDRAKLLDRLIDAGEKLAQFIPDKDRAEEIAKWSQEILTLDAENKAGLKDKYAFKALLAEAGQLKQAGKSEEAHAALDKALALPQLKGEQVQDVYFTKAGYYFSAQNIQKALDCLKKSLEAAPESPRAPRIRALIQRCESAMEQEKPKPEGLRLKLKSQP